MKQTRNTFLSLVFVTIVLALGFVTLYNNQGHYLDTVAQKLDSGEALVLDGKLEAAELSKFLLEHEYISDPKDAGFIAEQIVDKIDSLGGKLPNLGKLNTKRFKVPTALADSMGGDLLRSRRNTAVEKLGWDTTVRDLYDNPGLLQQNGSYPKSHGDKELKVCVVRSESAHSFFGGILKKLGISKPAPADSVLVALRQHHLVFDTVTKRSGEIKIDTAVYDTIVQYAFTDNDGVAVFKVFDSCAYSVLPIKADFNYGAPKGIRGKKKIVFEESANEITLFSSGAYKRIKGDDVLVVRTPNDYRDSLIISLVLFIAVWWLVFLFVEMRDRRLKTSSDILLLAILMTLTGLGLLTKFAIANPLSDMLLGRSALIGTLIGLLAMSLLVRFDVLRFYNNGVSIFGTHIEFDFVMQFFRWAKQPFSKKLEGFGKWINSRTSNTALQMVARVAFLLVILLLLPIILIVKLIVVVVIAATVILSKIPKIGSKIPKVSEMNLPHAIGYLFLSFALLVLLSIFGSGPEGSGAKVNLGPVQVSEVVKFLTMIFVAAFFAEKSELLQAFSDKQSIFAKRQIMLVSLVLVFMALLMAFFMKLSDGGPAMVILLSFLLIYSVARRDTVQLFLGVASFVALLLIIHWVSPTSVKLMAFFALLWFVVWIAYSWLRHRCIFESAIFFNLIIVAFLFGGDAFRAIGSPDLGDRMDSRTSMAWNGVWDNEATGGDQVAMGYWSLASGGFSGQGLGKGHPNVTPAYHTDMILSSIGEEMGWASLVLIVLCMAILVHRSLLIARKTGHSFAFFLIAGLAIVTGIQFLVIVLGSLGLIPLTGVTVPLLSHGNSSIIVNLIIFGVILSLSRQKATERQLQYIRGKYDGIIAIGSLSFIAVGAFVVCWLFGAQVVKRNDILIRPAFVTNKQGARIVEYNPRIDILMRKLHAGNIYDRNGVLIATSVDTLLRNSDIVEQIRAAGISPDVVGNEIRNPKRRYYPFGDHLFFMLGDFNTRTLWDIHDNNPYGYFAESRHLAQLRGFDNIKRDKKGNPEKKTLKSRKYRYSPYIDREGSKEFVYTLYDYSPLLPMLKAGDDSRKVKKWNEEREKRDIAMTIDAKLQVHLQNDLHDYIDNQVKRDSLWRASVVVLDMDNGDLLCSANYPLPNQDTIVAKSGLNYYKDNVKGFRAYTDRDLGMTYQTPPGSTAKVMSAMAGLMKNPSSKNKIYKVYREEEIDVGKEPPSVHIYNQGDETSMREAIAYSSNLYFINLVNDMRLYDQLYDIYKAVGIRLGNHTPYYMFPTEQFDADGFRSTVDKMSQISYNNYTKYIEERDKNQKAERMLKDYWMWSWGQGTMSATPLNMARVASIVANNGTLVQTRYLMSEKTISTKVADTPLDALKAYMEDEARAGIVIPHISIPGFGGKTGTPMRDWTKNKKRNDAWYICFIDAGGNQGKRIAVAVRFERTAEKGTGSGLAKRFVSEKLLLTLKNLGYLKY